VLLIKQSKCEKDKQMSHDGSTGGTSGFFPQAAQINPVAKVQREAIQVKMLGKMWSFSDYNYLLINI
jgi:hypothetical protein